MPATLAPRNSNTNKLWQREPSTPGNPISSTNQAPPPNPRKRTRPTEEETDDDDTDETDSSSESDNGCDAPGPHAPGPHGLYLCPFSHPRGDIPACTVLQEGRKSKKAVCPCQEFLMPPD